MTTALQPTDVQLYQRFRADNEDHAAFETLYRHYYAPPSDGEAEQDGDNLVDLVIRKHRIRWYDAEDVVAELWADLVINQPDICECFRAFVYNKLGWLVSEYWRKKRRPEEPWEHPWCAKTNQFLPPGAEAKAVVRRTDRVAAVRDPRDRAERDANFLDLAVLQAALSRLPPDEEQALRLHKLSRPKLTLEQAAQAAGTTLSPFRDLEKRALERLPGKIWEVKREIGDPADRHALLMQWGDERPDWHWVPDDENMECDCSECEAIWRKKASLRGCSTPPRLTASPPPPLRILVTDADGYKLPWLGHHQVVAQYLVVVQQGQSPSRAMLRTVFPGQTISRWIAAGLPA